MICFHLEGRLLELAFVMEEPVEFCCSCWRVFRRSESERVCLEVVIPTVARPEKRDSSVHRACVFCDRLSARSLPTDGVFWVAVCIVDDLVMECFCCCCRWVFPRIKGALVVC